MTKNSIGLLAKELVGIETKDVYVVPADIFSAELEILVVNNSADASSFALYRRSLTGAPTLVDMMEKNVSLPSGSAPYMLEGIKASPGERFIVVSSVGGLTVHVSGTIVAKISSLASMSN